MCVEVLANTRKGEVRKKNRETNLPGNVGGSMTPKPQDVLCPLYFPLRFSLFVLLSISKLENGKWNGDVCKVGRGYREGGGRSEKVSGGGSERLWGRKHNRPKPFHFPFSNPPKPDLDLDLDFPPRSVADCCCSLFSFSLFFFNS